ncbi:MAG: hypothetical protein WBI84_12005 [Burkholderiaceae bacterium]
MPTGLGRARYLARRQTLQARVRQARIRLVGRRLTHGFAEQGMVKLTIAECADNLLVLL